MRILVTGGAGFVGSHLIDALLKNGDSVVCVDNLFTGSRDNIAHLIGKKNFVFIEHDIVNPLHLEERVEQIYNLACPASPVHYQHNPIHTIKASTIGVINMLGLARKHRARFLQASTSEVYGDPTVSPQAEEYRGNVNTVGPRACYDEGKRVSETLCSDYHRMHGLEIKIVRIFNTYGPRMAQNDGRVVSNFIVQALQSEPVTIYGDGNQTRSFCYVDDLVSGLIKMMNSDAAITGPINLGNPGERTMNDIAHMIIDLVGSKSAVVHQPLPVDDPRQRCPDISKAKRDLGWEPTVDFDTGLRQTIQYFTHKLKRA